MDGINRSPCLGCSNRQIGCHGGCDAYGAFAALRQAISDDRAHGAVIRDYTLESIRRRERKERR